MKLSIALLLAIASIAVAHPANVHVNCANNSTASEDIEKRAGAGKRGLAWPWYNAPLDVGKFKKTGNPVNVIYDWETYLPPSTNGKSGLNYIGMQRCLDCDSSPIAQLAARQKELGFATVFTLNEPDLEGISPTTAVNWYLKYINPLRIKKAIPAVTSASGPNNGLDWAKQFVAGCAGRCYFDYINIHWYGATLQQFKDHVKKTRSMFPKYQIVITEFALQNPKGGQAAQIAFYKEAFKFLDPLDYVAMYFPFVASSPALFAKNDPNGAAYVGTGSTLFNNDGSVSAVGKLLLA
ncbi:Glyco-hydro-cc domain-containing protein [Mycena kentingensis (nom. inval.)]|nr:Glyco-hydro-cc domain-containing protein [Mycena kentingensis (nom. inval.)]